MTNVICPNEFKEWEKAYDEWKDCKVVEEDRKEDAIAADLAFGTACAGAIAASGTIVGGVIGGAACLTALWNLKRSIKRYGRQIDECRELGVASNNVGDKYKKCVGDHKSDPVVTPLVEPIVTPL